MIDVLIITAIQEEYDAAIDAASVAAGASLGVASWEEKDANTRTPYVLGKYVTDRGFSFSVALARPTRMGGTATSPVVASLVERLKPRCLAMCGVCAGNPGDVALGDVIIAEMVYPYDEGKQKQDSFEGDHRQTPMRDDWVRAAQQLIPEGLPSYGAASEEEAKIWLLERLYTGDNPRTHTARSRYFSGGAWKERVKVFEDEELVCRNGLQLELTDKGRSLAEEYLFYEMEPPRKLPFHIKVGPMASGNVVVKDGITWEKLKGLGVRTVLGLEMEAATIGSIAHRLGVEAWVVAKGVMDHADPRKDDRYKPFAARASAETLFKFLSNQIPVIPSGKRKEKTSLVKRVYVIGGVTQETPYPEYEPIELQRLCTRLGEVIAEAGAELVVCSPFPDSADTYTVMGYVKSGAGGKVHFHSPRHQSVVEKRTQLQVMLGENSTSIIDWHYPGPEDEESWGQAWLLCQLQALEHADAVIAIGGRLSKTANTLLHLAEAHGIPVVPFAFFGGAAKRAFERRDWEGLYPDLNHTALSNKEGINEAINIADRLVVDRIRGFHRGSIPPRTFFISRASSNFEHADILATYLERAGFTPLLGEREIRDERTVQSSIEEAILKSDVCIVLWSQAYATSRWCYDELELALERERLSGLKVWLFNLDESDVVPRQARNLPQAVVRTPQALIDAVRALLDLSV